jgi:hemoglobin
MLALALLAGCAAPQPEKQDSLYRALGGEDGIDKIVDDILFSMLRSPLLRDSFRDLSLTDYPRFKYNFAQQLCELSGGPCRYTGPDMRAAHAGLNVSEEQFNESGRIIAEVLTANGVPAEARQVLLRKLGAMGPEIIGQ